MEIKTLERIKRRLEGLEMHHIDTSVIIETDKTPDGRCCRKYLQLTGYKYLGKFSSITMSELFMTLFEFNETEDRLSFIRFLEYLRNRRKVDFYTPQRIGRLLEEIAELDTRLEPHDIMIIACAIEDGASRLVTLDKKLIHHVSIENKYKLKIVHPRELI